MTMHLREYLIYHLARIVASWIWDGAQKRVPGIPVTTHSGQIWWFRSAPTKGPGPCQGPYRSDRSLLSDSASLGESQPPARPSSTAWRSSPGPRCARPQSLIAGAAFVTGTPSTDPMAPGDCNVNPFWVHIREPRRARLVSWRLGWDPTRRGGRDRTAPCARP